MQPSSCVAPSTCTMPCVVLHETPRSQHTCHMVLYFFRRQPKATVFARAGDAPLWEGRSCHSPPLEQKILRSASSKAERSHRPLPPWPLPSRPCHPRLHVFHMSTPQPLRTAQAMVVTPSEQLEAAIVGQVPETDGIATSTRRYGVAALFTPIFLHEHHEPRSRVTAVPGSDR